MFSGCTNLQSLGVSSFNIENKNIDNMFCNCSNLDIDISSFTENAFTCVEQCKEPDKYLIEDKNICVRECNDT